MRKTMIREVPEHEQCDVVSRCNAMPTEDEIRAACEEIQAGWANANEHKVQKDKPYEIPGVEAPPQDNPQVETYLRLYEWGQ